MGTELQSQTFWSEYRRTGSNVTDRIAMTDLNEIPSIARFLPATLIPDVYMSDEALETEAAIALDKERIRCERNEKGKLRLYAPTPETIWNMIRRFDRELRFWVHKTKRAGTVCARRRFFLPDESVLCPDIAYIAPTDGEKPRVPGFGLPLKFCPNFALEFCQHPKELRPLKDKMLRWIASGADLGWLVVPQEQCMYVYAPSAEPSIMEEYACGQGPLDEFVFLLSEIWGLDEYTRGY